MNHHQPDNALCSVFATPRDRKKCYDLNDIWLRTLLAGVVCGLPRLGRYIPTGWQKKQAQSSEAMARKKVGLPIGPT